MLENLPTDKIYKFLTFLGIVILVTIYNVKENKSEQVYSLFETIYQKNDSLLDIVQRVHFLMIATSENEKRLDSRDSMTFHKVTKSKDTSELRDFLRQNQKVIDGINSSMDSSAMANANLSSIIESKQREISTFQKKLELRKRQLDDWSYISLWLGILGSIFFIMGISTWFLRDRTENSLGRNKVNKIPHK